MRLQRPKRSHEVLVRLAQDALEREEYEEAQALARRALMVRPDSLVARQVVASSLIEKGEFDEAILLLTEILAQDPNDLPALADLGLCLFETCRFDEAEAALTRALEVEPNDPQARYWLAVCLERRGDYEAAEECFTLANEADHDAYPLPTRISDAAFRRALDEALGQVPEEIHRQIENLKIIVDDLPREEDLTDCDPPLDPCLYGLYVGIPLTERSVDDPQRPRLPDRIYLYKRNLERFCGTRDVLVQEIRITLLHEIGHYLGFDEDELAERGLA
ncbi:MAG: tetratricopeptide repeat protein [Acidobacteriota bacterium]|nr:MAG: tetratricopeptide repeat protein [Acidobacteriota bacterium]